MTRHVLRPLLWTLLPLAGMGAAQAENPKISLKVVDMPTGEVIKKLSEAVGQPIELSAGHLAPEKVTFDWSSATLGRALRDLCNKHNLQPNKKPGGGYSPACPSASVSRSHSTRVPWLTVSTMP